MFRILLSLENNQMADFLASNVMQMLADWLIGGQLSNSFRAVVVIELQCLHIHGLYRHHRQALLQIIRRPRISMVLFFRWCYFIWSSFYTCFFRCTLLWFCSFNLLVITTFCNVSFIITYLKLFLIVKHIHIIH